MNRIGVDINNHGYWKAKKRSKQRKNASKYCQTITFLRCMPHDGAPPGVCVSYLRMSRIMFLSYKIRCFEQYQQHSIQVYCLLRPLLNFLYQLFHILACSNNEISQI